MSATLLNGCTTSTKEAASNTTVTKATSKTETKELSEVRVGYIPDINGAAPIVIGEEKGFFKEAGIKVTPTKFLSGPPEFQAMAAGELDIAYIGPGATFLAAQGKGKIIAVASLSKSDKLLATKSSGIKSWADLKGKTVGVPKGTSGEMILNLGLEKVGLKPSDVNIINLEVAGAVSSFIANKVDAVAIWSPYTAEIEKHVGKDNILVVGDNEQFYPEYVFPASWVVNPTFLEKKPEVVEQFLQAWIASNDYKLKNIEETITLTAAFTQVPEDSLRSQLKDIEWIESSKIAAYLQDGTAKKWYENLQHLFVKSEKLKEVVPAEQFLVSDLFNNAINKLVK
ncbi:aliphatic sulfonate ABC transporter substrate-binding protein [Paenibacillus sp. GSMTC-2017]|nr:aliphatic sulfonate ABC transporter substrate-binding protein [Paenibacillus sp. GSMTC-2017]